MAWLLRDGEVLAVLEIAASRRARRIGVLGRREVKGAILLTPAKAVHTFGVRIALDVAFLNDEMKVLETKTMSPWRICLPRFQSAAIVEAQAGAFERWGLAEGDYLEVAP